MILVLVASLPKIRYLTARGWGVGIAELKILLVPTY
jgi:hypothetical protein